MCRLEILSQKLTRLCSHKLTADFCCYIQMAPPPLCVNSTSERAAKSEATPRSVTQEAEKADDLTSCLPACLLSERTALPPSEQRAALSRERQQSDEQQRQIVYILLKVTA